MRVEESMEPEDFLDELPGAIGKMVINRLTYVLDPLEKPLEWMPVHVLADRIGATTRWVHHRINDFGIGSEVTEYQGRRIACYPPFALALLRDEFEWRKEFASLPPLLTMSELSERVGRSWGWTDRALAELRIRPARREWRPGRKVGLYYKGTLKQLRSRAMSYPLEDGWHNMGRWCYALARIGSGCRGGSPKRVLNQRSVAQR